MLRLLLRDLVPTSLTLSLRLGERDKVSVYVVTTRLRGQLYSAINADQYRDYKIFYTMPDIIAQYKNQQYTEKYTSVD